MQTKSHVIMNVEEIPAGSLLYCPELGDGILCIAANYHGHPGRSSMLIPLSGVAKYNFAFQTIRVENLSERVVLTEGFRAEVDLSSTTNLDHATAHVAKDGTYIRLRSERPVIGMRQCLRLEDGIIYSYPPMASVGFTRWWIASEDDPNEVLWDSATIENQISMEAQHGR